VQARSEAKVSCPVEVVDTQQVSMGLGMAVMAAAAAVQKGCDLEEATAVVRRASELAECIALFETLEYLQKGGRVGKAGALIGSLLRIRPMIIIRDGEVHELAKERSRPRGIQRLQRTARDFAPVDELAVLYSTTPDDARAVADDLSDLLPDSKEPIIARFGPVVGTYAGPGALGLGLLRSGPA
jgi:DegV family protein with EDD domain